MLGGRQKNLSGWLLCADELGEEAALGENLVGQDGADRVDLLMRPVLQQFAVSARHRLAVLLVSLA
jgi:hypothetical protein